MREIRYPKRVWHIFLGKIDLTVTFLYADLLLYAALLKVTMLYLGSKENIGWQSKTVQLKKIHFSHSWTVFVKPKKKWNHQMRSKFQARFSIHLRNSEIDLRAPLMKRLMGRNRFHIVMHNAHDAQKMPSLHAFKPQLWI